MFLTIFHTADVIGKRGQLGFMVGRGKASNFENVFAMFNRIVQTFFDDGAELPPERRKGNRIIFG